MRLLLAGVMVCVLCLGPYNKGIAGEVAPYQAIQHTMNHLAVTSTWRYEKRPTSADKKRYEVLLEADGVFVKITFEEVSPAWYPETLHVIFSGKYLQPLQIKENGSCSALFGPSPLECKFMHPDEWKKLHQQFVLLARDYLYSGHSSVRFVWLPDFP